MSVVTERPLDEVAAEGPAHAPCGHDHAADPSKLRTADANRLFYAEHARAYDGAEHCVAHAAQRELLTGLLERSIDAAATPSPRTLDACGGTGNVSELLVRRGIETTLVDVSPEMLARWREKAEALGADAEVVEDEIDAFLLRDEREWDLIVLSSALHHLDDPAGVAVLAAERLAPGGVLLTAFDPIRTDDALTRRLRRFDYLLSLAVAPRALAAALGRRFRRRGAGGVNVGDLAEVHALAGVDDRAIAGRLEAAGLEFVEHRRYACQRYRLTDLIFRATRRATTFHLIARRPDADAGSSTAQRNPRGPN